MKKGLDILREKQESVPVDTGSSMVLSNPWAALPALGNLDAYITAVNRMPMLSLEEEQRFGRALKEKNDLEAAGNLIMSHLRLVVSVSRQYLGYGLPQGDLIQEGNIGLMKAVKRFDPSKDVRLVSYALHWIRAEIHEYILRNWRMVKVATTKAQRRLFFNLRSMKQAMKEEAASDASHRNTLSEKEVNTMAERLGVKREDVIEMETRMGGSDMALDLGPEDSDDSRFAPIAYLSDSRHEPTEVLAKRDYDHLVSGGIQDALMQLDERSRRIVEERWLNVNDDGSGGMTLHDLAEDYNISAERVRQIEVTAMKKMREALSVDD